MKSLLIKRDLLSIKSSPIILTYIELEGHLVHESIPSLNCNVEQKEIDCSPKNYPTNG